MHQSLAAALPHRQAGSDPHHGQIVWGCRGRAGRWPGGIYERITVAGPEIVGVRLTAAVYAHGLALALPEGVGMARPTVSEATT